MKSNLLRGALACAALMLSATTAFATVTPSSGTPVGVDHDPGGIIATGTTDAKGNVSFGKIEPGRYSFLISDTSTLKTPATILVTSGVVSLTSAPILPGKGKAYALDGKGRKLVVEIGHSASRIAVNVSQYAGNGQARAAINTTRSNIKHPSVAVGAHGTGGQH